MATLSAKRNQKKYYHHGDLRRVLIETTLKLVDQVGPENVTVRKVALLAGVSSAAPFRHFPDRCALMTAVAEEAMGRFRQEIAVSLKRAARANPLERIRAVGDAYIRWATQNPSHFKVISDRSLIDFDGSVSLVRDNLEIQAKVAQLLREAQSANLIPAIDVDQFQLAGRALLYGLARMYSDGHFSSWKLDESKVAEIALALLDILLGAKKPGEPKKKRRQN